MEVIRNATETVSPLTYLRGRKESLLVKLDEESRRTQEVIKTQNSKRQEVMVYLVLGAFCALCSCLIIMAKESMPQTIYIPGFIIMVVAAVAFLVFAIVKYPASVKYQATWANYKSAKTYEEVLKESLSSRKKIKESISRLNLQLKHMDDNLEMNTIPDDK
ncbi:MAG: hypothetical protein K6F92_03405 [Lachnospiraceae bacterium]|nr:hypothetical protein [Lachnospiraceae bacterium]